MLALPFLPLSPNFCAWCWLSCSSYFFGFSLIPPFVPLSLDFLRLALAFPFFRFFSGYPTFSGLFATSTSSAIGLFSTLCLGSLTFAYFVPFSLDDCHTTFISTSLKRVRYTALLLENDYAFQHPISLLSIYKKRSQPEMEEANYKKF